ncbi:HSP20-like chaperone [Aspergillus ellipticus CBS 707.79]|uniref:HSP20-like chaperone n=1 Tax=Aspergillus ellipticus CBS 707.79 TaxID=1448320 RepID=A0A319DFU9_9EURO|nr:HSP20-like chaperone [Aspergillus ellipticus CBS 707.79]
MASIRQLNQAGPFWDFVSNMEEQGFAHPFFPDINHNHMPGDETDQSGPGGFPFGGQFAHRGRHGHHHHRRRHHEPVTEDDEETAQEETNDDDEGSSSSDDNDDNDAPRGSSPRRDTAVLMLRKWVVVDAVVTDVVAMASDLAAAQEAQEDPVVNSAILLSSDLGVDLTTDLVPTDLDLTVGLDITDLDITDLDPPALGLTASDRTAISALTGFKHGGRGKHHRGFGPWGHVGSHDHKHHKGDFFHPEVDVFDTPEVFVVHASLPGAKKDAVEVQWDPKKFELNISGVIERPGGEELLKTLALDERRIGTFDRKVRLGSVAQPVEINVDGITAEMENGILSVKLPKVESDVVMVTKVDIQ